MLRKLTAVPMVILSLFVLGMLPTFAQNCSYPDFPTPIYGTNMFAVKEFCGTGDVLLMDIGSKKVFNLTNSPNLDEKTIVASPGGKQLAWLAVDPAFNFATVIYNVQFGTQYRIESAADFAFVGEIAGLFSAPTNGGMDDSTLFYVDLNTQAKTQVGIGGFPVVNVAGKLAVYTQYKTGGRTLHFIRLQGNQWVPVDDIELTDAQIDYATPQPFFVGDDLILSLKTEVQKISVASGRVKWVTVFDKGPIFTLRTATGAYMYYLDPSTNSNAFALLTGDAVTAYVDPLFGNSLKTDAYITPDGGLDHLFRYFP